MAKQGQAARKAALQLLHGVLFDHQLLSHLVEWREGPLKPLDGPERARAQALAKTVLRHIGPLDAVIEHFLEKPVPMQVQNILRVCAAEIMIDKVAPHGAVDGAVALVKSKRKAVQFAGVVNAVGRKFEAEGTELFEQAPHQHLPSKFRTHLTEVYGEDRVSRFEIVQSKRPPVDITAPTDTQSWAERLNGTLLPTGSIRLQTPGQLSALPGFQEGAWWVQDAAAAIGVKSLGDLSGKTALDLCAAPGGKTLQLIAAGADVTAVDSSKARMRRLNENLLRMKMSAHTLIKDITKWAPDQKFDVVLLDAPCSASGTIRRHPDLPFVKPEPDLTELVSLQRTMLKRAAEWLTPGGQILFATCSLFPQEGEQHLDFVADHLPELRLIPLNREPLGLPAGAGAAGQALRLSPDLWSEMGGMDGFFFAKFIKSA